MKLTNKILTLLLTCLVLSGCNDFVDIQPKGELEPRKYSDLRKVLDSINDLNESAYSGVLAADNLTYTDEQFQSLENKAQSIYIWDENIYSSSDQVPDWNKPYKRVYHANLVLNRISETSASKEEKNGLRGEALYHRSHAFFDVALLFAKAYDPSTASEDLGIPLRETTVVNKPSERATLEKTYTKIISDLKKAAQFLPESVEYVTRPSKPAAYSLLARVYLNMGMYEKARQYALDCLDIKDALIDFNNVSVPRFGSPFEQFNKETILHTKVQTFGLSFSTNNISPDLYSKYEDADLRKQLFFSSFGNRVFWNGSYAGFEEFTGQTTAEMYLIAAEGYVRSGQYDKAEQYLNELLKHRYESGSFTPYESNNKEEFLKKIVLERRKELVNRHRRWFDLKRYNKESWFSKTLTRNVQGETYTLEPNDPKYVFPIPPKVIQESGLKQNPR